MRARQVRGTFKGGRLCGANLFHGVDCVADPGPRERDLNTRPLGPSYPTPPHSPSLTASLKLEIETAKTHTVPLIDSPRISDHLSPYPTRALLVISKKRASHRRNNAIYILI